MFKDGFNTNSLSMTLDHPGKHITLHLLVQGHVTKNKILLTKICFKGYWEFSKNKFIMFTS